MGLRVNNIRVSIENFVFGVFSQGGLWVEWLCEVLSFPNFNEKCGLFRDSRQPRNGKLYVPDIGTC